MPWVFDTCTTARLRVTGFFGSVAVARAWARAAAARATEAQIAWGAESSAVALAVMAAVALLAFRGRITARLFSITLALVIGADLWLNATHFWVYSPDPSKDLFRSDQVTERATATPLPYR